MPMKLFSPPNSVVGCCNLIWMMMMSYEAGVSGLSPQGYGIKTTANTNTLLHTSSNSHNVFYAKSARSRSSRNSIRMNMMIEGGLDEWLYQAGAMASDLVGSSLSPSAEGGSSLSMIPVMYGAGLLTSFSPCVWGILPLTMSYISSAAGETQDQKTTLPTLAYAAGLASVFGGLGIVASTVGGVLGASGGGGDGGESIGITSLVLPLFSNLVCLVMGLQLLDFLRIPSLKTIRLPSFNKQEQKKEQPLILLDGTGSIMTSAEETTTTENKSIAGTLFRTFLLGGTSALVASPCATPVLASILAYVASTQNTVTGAILLVGYTLGYATPLLIVASTGGQALVELRRLGSNEGGTQKQSIYGIIAPWVTPLTGGVLLWYGTTGVLTSLLGDPSLAGLAPIIE